MTNEEIRKRFETFVGLGGRILYDECDVYKLQDLTRADEREKVIKEIEDYLVPCNVGIQAIGDHHYYRDLLTKLNSLREAR